MGLFDRLCLAIALLVAGKLWSQCRLLCGTCVALSRSGPGMGLLISTTTIACRISIVHKRSPCLRGDAESRHCHRHRFGDNILLCRRV